MDNPYYLGVAVTAFASAVSQILLSISARKRYPSKRREYLNPWVISAYGILIGVLVSNIYLLRFMDLKEENAIAAASYVFVPVLSCAVLKERMSWKKVLANVFIVAGILLFLQTA